MSPPAERVIDFTARRIAEDRRRSAAEEPELPLNTGGPGGTSGGMDPALMDAKIAAAEARTDTKFEKVLSRLDSIDGKLTRIEADNIRTRSTVRSTGLWIIGAVLTVLAIVATVFFQSFNLGAKVAEVASAQVHRAPQSPSPVKSPQHP